MSDLHDLPLVFVKPLAARQALLAVDAGGTAVARGHLQAGQYCLHRLFADDVPRPVALASRPGRNQLELLLKAPEERLARVLSLVPGEKVALGVPQGRGFPVDAARGRDVWLLAGGTGVSPLKAVVERILEERGAFGDVVLLYGVRHADELCFRELFASWLGQGVRVVPVVSRTSSGAAPWPGAKGHVQDHIPEKVARPADTFVFVCGPPEMERDVGVAFVARGVPPEKIFRNW
jgi:sulfhydrogenase subunit gamma (sulfur reductase)